MTFKKLSGMVLSVVFTAGTLLAWNATASADRTIKLAGFGVKSGVVRSFGINTEAVLNAAVKHVNESGGVKLGDGTSAQMELVFHDDRCKAEEGISVLRRIAGTEALVAIGPTCSNVAEPLFGILQKKVGDAGDSGLQMPIFTDTAIKGGLAKISEWAFPERAKREHHVQGSVCLAQTGASRSADAFWRCGAGLCPFTVHLAQGYEGPGPGSRFLPLLMKPSGCSTILASRPRSGR
ncbi:MAG: hypothetical protein CM1200mP20_04840 [Pseudomonadota bacterium]|nr:MAG: hypothetical protein CM1200mP20_04840 [Pseudomonadota bacterium]